MSHTPHRMSKRTINCLSKGKHQNLIPLQSKSPPVFFPQRVHPQLAQSPPRWRLPTELRSSRAEKSCLQFPVATALSSISCLMQVSFWDRKAFKIQLEIPKCCPLQSKQKNTQPVWVFLVQNNCVLICTDLSKPVLSERRKINMPKGLCGPERSRSPPLFESPKYF